jgi:hypothetical protein
MMGYMLGRFFLSLPSFLPLLALTLVPVGSATAQQASTQQPSPRERTLLAESYVNERLALWQQRLNLQEWNITVAMARSGELKPKTLGNIHWDLPKKTALIHVLDPADYRLPYPEMLKDMEFTIVHELIHLELAPILSDLQRNDANRRDEEHSVNHMADALLKLDRSKP